MVKPRLLLSENFPLRTADQLGDFTNTDVLPWHLGDLTASPVACQKLTDRTYFVADHAVTALAVQVAGQPSYAWTQRTRVDGGVLSTYIEFDTAPASAAAVTATFKGKRYDDGTLAQFPWQILAMLFAEIQRPLASTLITQLRALTGGMRVAGSIDRLQSNSAWIDEVAFSAGLVWTPRAFARYPDDAPAQFRISLTHGNSSLARNPVAIIGAVAGSVRVSYARNQAQNRAGATIVLATNDARYANQAEISAPWLRQAVDAGALGQRHLKRMASVPVSLEIAADVPEVEEGGLDAVAACRWVSFQCAYFSAPAFILSRPYVPGAKQVTLAAEAVLNAAPAITIVSHSIELPPTIHETVEIAGTGATRTITVRDDNGRPLSGAKVALDGGEAKTTDNQGQVTFVLQAGHHFVVISYAGFDSQKIEFDL